MLVKRLPSTYSEVSFSQREVQCCGVATNRKIKTKDETSWSVMKNQRIKYWFHISFKEKYYCK